MGAGGKVPVIAIEILDRLGGPGPTQPARMIIDVSSSLGDDLCRADRVRIAVLLKANAAPRSGARSKRTGKPCRGAAMPNGRCKLHGGKSTAPRTMEGLERSRRANWKHGHFSREAKAERSRVRAAI
jgi:hypothetical protein